MLHLEELKAQCSDWEHCVGLTCDSAGADGFASAKAMYSHDDYYKNEREGA